MEYEDARKDPVINQNRLNNKKWPDTCRRIDEKAEGKCENCITGYALQ